MLLKILNEIKYIFSDLCTEEKTQYVEYILLCHDDHRSVICNSKYYSPLTDSILDKLNNSGFSSRSFAIPYSKLSRGQAYGNPHSLSGPYSRARVIQKIYQFSIGKFKKNRSDRKLIVRFWINFLKKYNPREVICVQPSEELCSAGKICGVLISDIQHGIMDETRYYGSRENWQFSKEGVPDRVYCWDEHSASTIKKKWSQVDAVVFGNPFFQRLKISHKEFLDAKSEYILDKLMGKRVVLISLQYDENSLSTIDIPQEIVESIKSCQVDGVTFCVKFHPVQLRNISHNKLINIFKKTYGDKLWHSIIDVSDVPLLISLKFINYQIAASSASAIDAANFKVKTGFWEQNKKIENWFRSYIDSGFVEFLPKNHIEISKKISLELSLLKNPS